MKNKLKLKKKGVILPRRERKKHQLKEAIYNTAIELFLKKGYDHVTIEDITEKVDVAKGTFFNYFASKDAILPYFLSKHLEEIRERLPKEMERYKTAQQKLQHLFYLLGKLVLDNELLIKWVLMESFRLKVYQKEQTEIFGNILRIMVQILREGQEKDEFRKNIAPLESAEILESIFFFSAMRWLTYDNQTPIIEDLRNKVNYFLDGIKP
jgi:AcrR family transcriptional regulator